MARKQSLANKYRPVNFSDDICKVLEGDNIVWLYL